MTNIHRHCHWPFAMPAPSPLWWAWSLCCRGHGRCAIYSADCHAGLYLRVFDKGYGLSMFAIGGEDPWAVEAGQTRHQGGGGWHNTDAAVDADEPEPEQMDESGDESDPEPQEAAMEE